MENLENLKSLALKACISIFNDYVEWEVRKLPPATQAAWEIGKEYVEKELKGEGL